MIIVGLIDLNCRSLSYQKGHWIWFIEGHVWLLWLLWMNSIPRSRPQNHGSWRLSLKGHCIISHLSFKEALGFSWDLHVGKGLGNGWEKVEKRLKDVDFPTISQPFPKVFGGNRTVIQRLATSVSLDDLTPEWQIGGVRVKKWQGFWVFPIHTIRTSVVYRWLVNIWLIYG